MNCYGIYIKGSNNNQNENLNDLSFTKERLSLILDILDEKYNLNNYLLIGLQEIVKSIMNIFDL